MSEVTKEIARNNAVGKGGAGSNLPDRGTGTGMNGDTYGANLNGDATNSLGSFKGNSDPAAENCPGEC